MKPEPDQYLELEVVSSPRRYQGRGGNRGGGAALKLDARRFIRICHLIEAGQSHTNACLIEGISYTLLCLRVSERPKWKKRLERANKIRHELRYEWHMANITSAAERDPRLSAVWLDRHGWRYATPRPGSPGVLPARGQVEIPGTGRSKMQLDPAILSKFQRVCPLTYKALCGRRYLLPSRCQNAYCNQDAGIQQRALTLLGSVLAPDENSFPRRSELLSLLVALRYDLPTLFLDEDLGQALLRTSLPEDFMVEDVKFPW